MQRQKEENTEDGTKFFQQDCFTVMYAKFLITNNVIQSWGLSLE